MLAIGLAALDALAVIAALPEIGADLGEVALLPWVITGFLVTSTVAVVVAGPVIDTMGVRWTFRVSIVEFLVASAVCAIAPNLALLVAARVAQGLGGGLLVAVAFASVGVSYPERLMATMFAAESAVWGVMAFGGPAIASVLVSSLGWPWVFWANLPLGALAALAGWWTLPVRIPDAARLRPDRWGIVLIAGFVITVVGGLSRIGWTTAPLLIAATAAMVAYLRHERAVTAPVMAIRHLAGPPYGRLNLAAFTAMAAGLGADAYLPVYVRAARGQTTFVAAFSVLWLTMGWTIGGLLVSRIIERVGGARLIRIGFGLLLFALLANAVLIATDAALPAIYAAAAIVGVGVGIVASTTITGVQLASPPEEIGRANAAHQFARNLGITGGTAICGAALLLVIAGRIDDMSLVRDLLSGEEVSVSRETADAVAAGYEMTYLVGLAIVATGAVVVVRGLRRIG